jgi:hypothetical protein
MTGSGEKGLAEWPGKGADHAQATFRPSFWGAKSDSNKAPQNGGGGSLSQENRV